jgi:hypothetical protein
MTAPEGEELWNEVFSNSNVYNARK